FHLQEKQLRDHQVRNVIVNLANKNDAVLQQPRVNVVAAFAPTSLLHDHRDQHLRDIFVRYGHDLSSLTAGSFVNSMLTFAFRKSRVLPSRSCSATSSNAFRCCNSLRILSGEMSYRAASCLIRESRSSFVT